MPDSDGANSTEKVAGLESTLPVPLDDGEKGGGTRRSPEEMRTHLDGWLEEHNEDYNIPFADLERLRSFAAHQDEVNFDDEVAAKAFRIEFEGWYELFENTSPYLEVRAVVDFEDRGGPCGTFRAWLIGLVLACFGSGLNTLLGFRMPSIYIPPLVAQFVGYLLGTAMAKLPNWHINLGLVAFDLNPGPFSLKENILITLVWRLY